MLNKVFSSKVKEKTTKKQNSRKDKNKEKEDIIYRVVDNREI